MSERTSGIMADNAVRLFSRGEAFDSEGFVTFFTDKPVYQFGNGELCLDKAAIRVSIDNFFSGVEALYHDIKSLWEVEDTVFVEMDVIYWRKDGTSVTLPCADIFRFEGDKVKELRIFMDANPLYDKSIAVSKNASVMTVSEGKRVTPPDTMRKFFAENKEGIERVANGFAPKWSMAGPKWPISNIKTKIDLVIEMETAAGMQDWAKFESFFTKDVLYQVGLSEGTIGTQDIVDYVKWMFSIVEPDVPFEFRDTWEMGDTAIVEMDATYTRRSDGKPITMPCVDVLRFDGDKIREWRVYPDQTEMWVK